jgi:hypothetical protein
MLFSTPYSYTNYFLRFFVAKTLGVIDFTKNRKMYGAPYIFEVAPFFCGPVFLRGPVFWYMLYACRSARLTATLVLLSLSTAARTRTYTREVCGACGLCVVCACGACARWREACGA